MSRIHLLLATVAVLAVAPLALATSGHPQLQVFFASSNLSTAYQQKIYTRVAKNWAQPGPKQAPALGKRTVIQAFIDRDGKLVSAAVTMSSGSKAWDDAALSAVKKAAPYDKPPAGYSGATAEFHVHVAWEK